MPCAAPTSAPGTGPVNVPTLPTSTSVGLTPGPPTGPRHTWLDTARPRAVAAGLAAPADVAPPCCAALAAAPAAEAGWPEEASDVKGVAEAEPAAASETLSLPVFPGA